MNTAFRPDGLPTPQVSRPATLPARLTVARVLTGLLEHMERSRVPVDAGQYRLVAQRLSDELAVLGADSMLDAWLRHHPLAADSYENLMYAHAGLCRQPLAATVQAELATRELLDRMNRPVSGPPPVAL